jgi:transposase
MESETKKQKRARRAFTDEFRAGAVSLVLEKGKTVAQVARDLDLTQSSLSRWVEQARADKGKSTRGTLTTEEKEELARLRKENRELRLEREILKNHLAPAALSVAPATPEGLRSPGRGERPPAFW